jgi:hypothetical protein
VASPALTGGIQAKSFDEFKSAVAAEISGKVGADADDEAVKNAGQDIADRYAGDPTARYFITSAVTQIRSERNDAVIPMAHFIGYAQDVEHGYPNDTAEQNLTRMRVQYYNGLRFEALIPDAPYLVIAGTHHRASHGDEYDFPVTSPRRLERNAIGANAFRHLTAQTDVWGDNPLIVTPAGEDIDVGHLLVGLDALLHPQTNGIYSNYNVPNIDPSSWVGDLGAASVWTTTHERDGRPPAQAGHGPAEPDLDYYYRKSAPEEDLLGDVDSFGVKAQWDAAPDRKLSETLHSYYQDTGATSVQHRFEIFCSANNLKYTIDGNGTISWDPALVGQLTERVDRFNDLYAAGQLGVAWHAAWNSEPAHEKWPHTPKIVKKFLTWVKTNIEAELKKSSGGPQTRQVR